MKILFVGTFEAKYSTHHSLIKEFKKRGHNFAKFDFRYLPSKYMRLKNHWYKKFKDYFYAFISYRLNFPNIIRNLRFYLFGNWRMNKQLLNLVKSHSFDLIILAKAENVNYKLIPKLNSYSKTFYYFMDPLEISHEINAHKYASLSTMCSATTTVMTYLFKKSGGNSYYILEGYDDDLFKPNKENPTKTFDVVFVGANFPIRKKYINFLRENQINVNCFGPGWENEPIYFNDLVKLYRRSKIILNFPKEDSGFSDRVFHVMGTGSFILSLYCSDLPKIFKKEKHMDWFKSEEECLKLINYYLENDDLREKISLEGHFYASKNFSWKKTVDKMLHIIEQNFSN
ncbi:MAG: glycosyltransferase [Promethearchaeota archaeon]